MAEIYLLTTTVITLLTFSVWTFLPKIVYMLATGYYGVTLMSRIVTASVIVIFGIIQMLITVEMWDVVLRNIQEIVR